MKFERFRQFVFGFMQILNNFKSHYTNLMSIIHNIISYLGQSLQVFFDFMFNIFRGLIVDLCATSLELFRTKPCIYKIIIANHLLPETGCTQTFPCRVNWSRYAPDLFAQIFNNFPIGWYNHRAATIFIAVHRGGWPGNKTVATESNQLCLSANDVGSFTALVSGNKNNIRFVFCQQFNLLIKIHVITSWKTKTNAIKFTNTPITAPTNAPSVVRRTQSRVLLWKLVGRRFNSQLQTRKN